jgi:uncharacterized protein involved in outer membrane biogenesis
MKRLGKYSLILILVICILLTATTAALHFLDLDPYRERIATLVTEAIGRQVKINGHIEVNLFPHPEVALNDVSLANAAWGSKPTMASVQHVDAVFSFLSLFSDTFIIRRLRVNDVIVLLEKNDQNVGNWVMGTADSSAKTGPEKTGRVTDEIGPLPVMVDSAELRNVTLTVRDPEGTGQVYHLSSFSLQSEESGNLILNSSGELVGYPIELNCQITSKASVSAQGTVNMDLQASLGDAALTGQISTSRLATLADLQGTFHIAVKDIQEALKKAKLEVPLTGPLTADATVSIDRSVYKATIEGKVEDITVTVDGSYDGNQLKLISAVAPISRLGELFNLQGLRPEALELKTRVTRPDADNLEIHQFQADVGRNRLTAQGRVTTGGDAALSLTLSSPDLNTFLETLPKIDLKAKAKIQHSTEKIAVSELAATFDKSDIYGNIAILKGDKPKIIAHLTSKLLDMRPFSELFEPNDKLKRATPAGSAKKLPEKKSTTGNQYVFKATPIPLAPLQTIEADAKIAIDDFFYDFLELKKVKIHAAFHGGHVDGKFKGDSSIAGHVAGKIDLKTRGRQATIDTLVSVSDFRPKVLQAEGVSLTEVPPISMTLELKTVGSSPRELASGANGRFLLTQGPGKIRNTAVKTLSSDIFTQLFSSLNPFAKRETFSNWECAVIHANLVDGLADIDGMLAQGEKVLIVGGGDIDLKTEKLNIEFNTKPRSGVGISADMFVTPFVKVKGTLASPSVGLDEKGTLITGLTGGAAIATGGLSLAIQAAIGRATAEIDQCKKALEIAGQHSRYDF